MLRNVIIIILATYAVISGVWVAHERERVNGLYENQRVMYSMMADNLRNGMEMKAEIADIREHLAEINAVWGPGSFELNKITKMPEK